MERKPSSTIYGFQFGQRNLGQQPNHCLGRDLIWYTIRTEKVKVIVTKISVRSTYRSFSKQTTLCLLYVYWSVLMSSFPSADMHENMIWHYSIARVTHFSFQNIICPSIIEWMKKLSRYLLDWADGWRIPLAFCFLLLASWTYLTAVQEHFWEKVKIFHLIFWYCKDLLYIMQIS